MRVEKVHHATQLQDAKATLCAVATADDAHPSSTFRRRRRASSTTCTQTRQHLLTNSWHTCLIYVPQEAAGIFDYLHANVPLRLDFQGLLDLAPDATAAMAAVCLAQVVKPVNSERNHMYWSCCRTQRRDATAPVATVCLVQMRQRMRSTVHTHVAIGMSQCWCWRSHFINIALPFREGGCGVTRALHRGMQAQEATYTKAAADVKSPALLARCATSNAVLFAPKNCHRNHTNTRPPSLSQSGCLALGHAPTGPLASGPFCIACLVTQITLLSGSPGKQRSCTQTLASGWSQTMRRWPRRWAGPWRRIWRQRQRCWARSRGGTRRRRPPRTTSAARRSPACRCGTAGLSPQVSGRISRHFRLTTSLLIQPHA